MIVQKGKLGQLKEFFFIGGVKGSGKSTRANTLKVGNTLAICFGGSNEAYWGSKEDVDKAFISTTELGDTAIATTYDTIIIDGLNVWVSLYNVLSPNQWSPTYVNIFQQLNALRTNVKQRVIVTCGIVEFIDQNTKALKHKWAVGNGLIEKLNPHITTRELVWTRYDTKNAAFVGFYQDNARLVSTFDFTQGITYNA